MLLCLSGDQLGSIRCSGLIYFVLPSLSSVGVWAIQSLIVSNVIKLNEKVLIWSQTFISRPLCAAFSNTDNPYTLYNSTLIAFEPFWSHLLHCVPVQCTSAAQHIAGKDTFWIQANVFEFELECLYWAWTQATHSIRARQGFLCRQFHSQGKTQCSWCES